MYLFISNPVARHGKAKAIMRDVAEYMSAQGAEFEVWTSEYAGHTVELAKRAVEQGYKNIIAVGGDGTVLEMVTGLNGSACNMGIIPAGTGNDFVRSIGVPRDPVEAVQVLLAGNTKQVDVGRTQEGKFFINVAGTGFDTDVIRFTEKFKALRGTAAYIAGILTALLVYRNREITYKTEDREFTGKLLLVAVANGATYAGGLKVAPAAVPTDGYFDVTVIHRMLNIKLPFVLGYFASGRHEKIVELESFRCKTITLSCPVYSPINMDGEIIGEAPMTFSICPAALTMFAPRQDGD